MPVKCVWILFSVLCLGLGWMLQHWNGPRRRAKPKRIRNVPPTPTIGCIYAYYEKNDTYRDNLTYFLENDGILPFVNHYFVVNGISSVIIPERPNVRVLRRHNRGYDFGAWGAALAAYPEISTLDFVFFVNTSVRGPYRRTPAHDWTQPFLRLFASSPDVRLVGTSINICTSPYFGRFSYGPRTVYPHVQSMFFALDRTGLQFLVRRGLFDEAEAGRMSFGDIIGEREIGMSLALLNHGWNINCILKRYKNLDYRSLTGDINPTSRGGDPYFAGAYFGGTIRPNDVIFYKNARFA